MTELTESSPYGTVRGSHSKGSQPEATQNGEEGTEPIRLEEVEVA